MSAAPTLNPSILSMGPYTLEIETLSGSRATTQIAALADIADTPSIRSLRTDSNEPVYVFVAASPSASDYMIEELSTEAAAAQTVRQLIVNAEVGVDPDYSHGDPRDTWLDILDRQAGVTYDIEVLSLVRSPIHVTASLDEISTNTDLQHLGDDPLGALPVYVSVLPTGRSGCGFVVDGIVIGSLASTRILQLIRSARAGMTLARCAGSQYFKWLDIQHRLGLTD